MNAGVLRIDIELPPLNMALVEVHKELVSITIGARDMAEKNKNKWKMIKLLHTRIKQNRKTKTLRHSQSNYI